jgi:transposase-like protein
VVKWGFVKGKTQNHKCRECGRHFVMARAEKRITKAMGEIINRLRCSTVPFETISLVLDVTEPALLEFIRTHEIP